MNYSIQDFVQLIAKLRDPNGGCPWDLEQTYQTMIPHLLEESYEVVEAIEQQNTDNLREELGDLLLQVVFFSQLAKEDNLFTFDEVINEVAEKILRRHPHVFGEAKAHNEQEALRHWNTIKAQENKNKAYQSILDNIPQSFPALMRAEKLQKRCAKVGFDWDNIQPVIAKVQEELQEVQTELARPQQEQAKIEEEIGDLLFAVVNLSRHLHCCPEEALRKANQKFERRFRQVETRVKQQGKSLQSSTLTELDLLWDDVKKQENC
ncbi:MULTISPECIES: nucleoside triphosphate pyrophosphohydrolase [unclassified Avibacterium]|uniref:nucleoside triphosphate pyrophosphohydrolase n=1 Tax=unclassified Avibacterium TaxID=2685287 RepID=UPI0020271041|nr:MULTISPECIES: nucleoside triphosphate pyrophosphohydrolase [unclassified Avibacterium]MCW9699162.1 nucleoside triphosphate pyrophosphohydrolase [Avibacterium sp. 20-129]MCW9732966.1 nucleoside triphosphate pyrophosphohydrolase [Avibacterium sp. 20-15]URL05099.1 nucleoside triphosphate pyrophosphohydrolase [Avibacterium sp. 20-132]URL06651.1 nucleoside triphosphate pyrophosphohydrolase [Avibacterium sp. 21-595]